MCLRYRSWTVRILILLLVLGVGGCVSPPMPGPAALPPAYDVGDSINIVQAANLATTQAIEIGVLQLDGDLSYPTVARIEDADTIRALVDLLDTDLKLTLPVTCVDQYRLHFILSDGDVVEFGYACEPDGSFLHGGIPPLMGYAVQPPAAFRARITAAAVDSPSAN